MRRSIRIRIVFVLMVLLAVWAVPAPAVAVRDIDPAGVDQVAVVVTEPVTDLPATGHGISEPSDARAVALEHSVLTVLVLLGAAGAALGGVALLWRYERR